MMEVLMEELIEEILLRLPPDDTMSLLRVATVCKQWCRVVSAPGFYHRFCERHRTALMLSFLAHLRVFDKHGNACTIARFFPTTPFRPPHNEHRDRVVVDVCHNHVLLCDTPLGNTLEVWGPVTSELQVLPALPVHSPRIWNVVGVCGGLSECGHLNCRHGPFHVIFVDVDTSNICVHAYSSEAAAWSEPTYGPPSLEYGVGFDPPALVGNAFYFLINESIRILEYNLATQSVSVIDLPSISNWNSAVLTTMEDNGLGFARVEDSKLCFWLMETSLEGEAVWARMRSIDLETLLPIDASIIEDCYVSFAHSIGVIFIRTEDVRFSIDIKSGQVREEERGDGETEDVIPYTSFYTLDYLHRYGVVPV